MFGYIVDYFRWIISLIEYVVQSPVLKYFIPAGSENRGEYYYYTSDIESVLSWVMVVLVFVLCYYLFQIKSSKETRFCHRTQTYKPILSEKNNKHLNYLGHALSAPISLFGGLVLSKLLGLIMMLVIGLLTLFGAIILAFGPFVLLSGTVALLFKGLEKRQLPTEDGSS